MTLNATTTKVSYNGDGASVVFDVSFKFLQNSHVVAILRDAAGDETTWTEGSEYTLTGAGDENGGTLTVQTSPNDFTPASGETLVIKRSVPETQPTDIPLGGAFASTTIEQMIDLLTMMVQAHSEELVRSIVVSDADPISSLILPSVVNRASKILAFDAAGEILTISNFGKWRDAWAASTAYVLGDVAQRSDTGDLYIAVATAFTSGTVEATDLTDTNRWALAMERPSVNFFADNFTGTGAQTAFTLSNAPVSAAATAVYLNGVRQEPVAAYTVVGTTLAFGAAPGNGVEVLAVYGNAGAATVADASITEPKLADGAVTADKLAPGAARQTGEMIDYLGASAPAGWILADGRTIGNASSGATSRANADTEDLFTLLWDSYANSLLAVSGGRGASAAADFAANKNIQVPDLRGRVAAGKDDMGGAAANRITSGSAAGVDGSTLGASGGVQEHQLTVTEMPAHKHDIPNRSGGSVGGNPSDSTRLQSANTAGGVGTYLNMATTGGDAAHTNTQPTWVVNKLVKL